MKFSPLYFFPLSRLFDNFTSTTMSRPTTFSNAYERMTSNCTRQIAEHMIATVSPPINQASSYILDNACGPGIVTSAIKAQYPNAQVLAADLNPGMIDEVRKRVTLNKWDHVDTAIVDVKKLVGIEDETFSHVFMNLGAPGPEDPDGLRRAVAEIFRVLKVGGVAMILYPTDRVWPAAFLKTARTIRPHEEPHNATALPREYMSASWLATQLERGGFGNNIGVMPCKTATIAGSLEELTQNAMLAKGMFFPGYSDEELRKAEEILHGELRNCRTYEEVEGISVGVGMKAFVGVGWKKGDEGEVPI